MMRKAVILCAGKGARMGGLTTHVPKVMLPFAGKPLLEHHLLWMKSYGIRDIFINVHYLPQAITDYFGDGKSFGVRIVYSREERLRGTAGALRGFRQELDATFLLHYGDIYSELSIAKMLRFHRESGGMATLAVHPTNRPHDSDVVVVGPASEVRAVYHKPGTDKYGLTGNAACYVLEPAVLGYIPDEDRDIDFIVDVFPRMIAAGERLYAYRATEFVRDMGTPERYESVLERLKHS
jgi:NDP-sugar pyrophosphorylase family protein